MVGRVYGPKTGTHEGSHCGQLRRLAHLPGRIPPRHSGGGPERYLAAVDSLSGIAPLSASNSQDSARIGLL